MAVDAVDMWLVESGVALQVWVSPVRVANCNLHGRQVGAGLSCVVYNTMVRQLVAHASSGAQPPGGPPAESAWLEVGSVSLGDLVVEAIMSLSGPEQQAPLMQNKFLRMHDERTKRLWFLWGDATTGRCGCIGGCAFFGANRNGARFFKPSRSDLTDGINIAAFRYRASPPFYQQIYYFIIVYRINEPGRDLGYGQSLLHEGQLLFRTPPYTAKEVILQELGRRPSSYNVKVR